MNNLISETKMVDVSQYVLPPETKVAFLDCETAFNGLTDQEKLYAHYISQASWYGGLICLFQVWLLLIIAFIQTKLNQPEIRCFFSPDNTIMWLEYNSSNDHCETFFFQTSPESPGIYLLFHKLFGSQSIEELQSAAEAKGVTKDEFHVSHGASATYCCCIHVHNQDFWH